MRPLVGRLLHDRTADKMASAVSRSAGATAQIVAYDVGFADRTGRRPRARHKRALLRKREENTSDLCQSH